MSLAVLADRSVLRTARNGTVRRTDTNGSTTLRAVLDVEVDGDVAHHVGLQRAKRSRA